MATEKRLIDANALIVTLEEIEKEDESEYFHLDEIIQEIFDSPTVDAVEVVHGRWVWRETGEEEYEMFWVCSKCGDRTYFETNYCPNCGAKMDGDSNE